MLRRVTWGCFRPNPHFFKNVEEKGVFFHAVRLFFSVEIQKNPLFCRFPINLWIILELFLSSRFLKPVQGKVVKIIWSLQLKFMLCMCLLLNQFRSVFTLSLTTKFISLLKWFKIYKAQQAVNSILIVNISGIVISMIVHDWLGFPEPKIFNFWTGVNIFLWEGSFYLVGYRSFDPQSAWYIAFWRKSNCRITNVYLLCLKQFKINHSTDS